MPRKGYERGFQPVLPLDAMIIELLPDEGTMFAGFFMEGIAVKEIAARLGGGIDSETINARTRTLHQFGLVVHHRVPKNAVYIYQATAKGRAFQLEHRPAKES